jgi:hypothetical protein
MANPAGKKTLLKSRDRFIEEGPISAHEMLTLVNHHKTKSLP